MQPGSRTVNLTNARPRERNSEGVRGRYVPVVPSLASIQRKRAASSGNPNARNTRAVHPGLFQPSDSSAEHGVPRSDRGDTVGRNTLDTSQDEITEQDRLDLMEFAALSSWSRVKHFPIGQIDGPTVQLGTASMKGLFADQDTQINIRSKGQHKPDEQAEASTPDQELTEFATLSHLPAIFGPIDPVP